MKLQIKTAKIPSMPEMVEMIKKQAHSQAHPETHSETLMDKIVEIGNLVVAAGNEMLKPTSANTIIVTGNIAKTLIEIEYLIDQHYLNLFSNAVQGDISIGFGCQPMEYLKDVFKHSQGVLITSDRALSKAIDAYLKFCMVRGFNPNECLAAAIYGIEEI